MKVLAIDQMKRHQDAQNGLRSAQNNAERNLNPKSWPIYILIYMGHLFGFKFRSAQNGLRSAQNGLLFFWSVASTLMPLFFLLQVP